MTMYAELAKHLRDHAYRRGAYKGDAPAGDRRKTHFRVSRPPQYDAIHIIFRKTNVITAYPDGRVALTMGTYHGRMTARAAVNEAMASYGFSMHVHSIKKYGVNQTTVWVGDRATARDYAYHSEMEMLFDANGMLLTEPLPWKAVVADRGRRKAFKQACIDSGFTCVFPLLYDTTPPPVGGYRTPVSIEVALQDPQYAEHWWHLIACSKYELIKWNHVRGAAWAVKHASSKECFKELMATMCKQYVTATTKV